VERRGAIALGYNGFPAGVDDDVNVLTKKEKRDLKRNMVVHAEENALLIAGHAAKGATLFVWGKPICARCAVSIIQSGIKKVVAIDPADEEDKTSIWHELGMLAIKLFREGKGGGYVFKVESRASDNSPKIILPDDKQAHYRYSTAISLKRVFE